MMSPSNGADDTDHVFGDLTGASLDHFLDNLFTGLESNSDSQVGLIPVPYPSTFPLDEALEELVGDCDDGGQLDTSVPVPLRYTAGGAAGVKTCPTNAVIPLTVLALDDDDAVNSSSKRTSSATYDVLIKSRSGPDDSNRRKGGVRRCQSSLGSSHYRSKAPKARNFSATSPLKNPVLFHGTGKTGSTSGLSVRGQVNYVMDHCPGPRLLESTNGNSSAMDIDCCRENSTNQMAATRLPQMLSPAANVPKLKQERRREQNRTAAFRCRNKRKREEDQLQKDFDLATKDNRLKRQEIDELSSQIRLLKTELQRHATTDHCFVPPCTLSPPIGGR